MLEIYRPTPPVHWDWLTLNGADSADFLHRLTTVNVRALQPREGSPGFFLTAQGKIRAYFRLWKVSNEEFFLEFNAGMTGAWKQELQNSIEQFHFAEKFEVETSPGRNADRVCVWILGDEAEKIVTAGQMREVDHLIRVFNHGSLDYGQPWVTAWGPHAHLDGWIRGLGGRLISFERIEEMRIERARPRVDFELSFDTGPLDAGLSEAISENKGCYPGQEVIEKIISLGSPARRLARIDGKGSAPEAGLAIFGAEAGPEVGKITSAIARGDGFQALGFLRKSHARAGSELKLGPQRINARVALVPEYKSHKAT